MSHLLLNHPVLQVESASDGRSPSVPKLTQGSLLKRLTHALFWYKRAVLASETPAEKAEWQKTSF